MRFKDNRLANLHDRWDEWHRAHTDAARGECRYRKRCPVYGRGKHLMDNK